MKKILLATLLACCLIFSFISCDKEITAIDLPAPAGVRVEGGYIMWNPVDHAEKYTISIDGNEYFCTENKYPISSISDGDHVVCIKANGDDLVYKTSVFSEQVPISLVEGVVASGGYYSQFDELTMQESFLGYGFDVINSSVFYDKTVKTSSPIFKTDELMKLRLLKVDSKRSYISEVQSESIDEFMNSWNSDLNVDVSWGKKRIGGSVSVEAAYSGGSTTAKAKYFHCMTFNNQKFYIVMQGTTSQYRDIISDGFEQDLYSDMSPAELFNKYGTHFITSAVMGGKINSYYLYTSDKETSFHDISASVSTNVRYWAGSTTVDVNGGYHQLAQSQNIYIKNTMEVIGGGDYGILSDADIGSKYTEWEQSLEEHPSLIGIKDSGSLCPIWTLIDPSKDTRTDYQWIDENGKLQTGSRAQQLQGYFMKYGVDNYNALAEAAGIPEIKQPESITNVLVNGKAASGGEYEVFSGIGNRVTFTVLPEDALGYSKVLRLSEATPYASISDDNTEIIVSDNAPHNTLLTVVISAGDVKKTIKVRVVKTFTVNFETNMDDVSIKNPEKYQEIRYGRQITAPEMDTPYGWEFDGWYVDPYFNTPYEFGKTPVIENMTLYAKWKVYRPQISFVTNIDGFTMDPIRVDFASKYVPDKTPHYDGYNFKGYFKDPALQKEYDFDLQVASDITLYLKWEPIVYTATFVADGITVDTVNFTVADSSIKEPKIPAKNGYSSRWDNYSIKAENITVNAIYSLIEYTVSFKILDEEIITKGYSYDNFETTIALEKPLRNDYLFMGWYDNPSFNGEPITQLTEAKDYDLYAKHLKASIDVLSYSTGCFGISYNYSTEDDEILFIVPDMHDNDLITCVEVGVFSLPNVTFMLPESVTDLEFGTAGTITIGSLKIEGTVTDLLIYLGGACGTDVKEMILGNTIKTVFLDMVDSSCNVFVPESVEKLTGYIWAADERLCWANIYFESDTDPEILSIDHGDSDEWRTSGADYYYGYSLEEFIALNLEFID